MSQRKYPPRLWGLSGYPGGGKSTFACQMRAPILVIDADQRFTEVLPLAGVVYELSDRPVDNTDPDRISAILAQQMPGCDVATIVVDSLTAIMAPLVTQAMVDKDAGRMANLAAGWRTKALAMRQLQDAVTRWATDTLWIYHLNDARDAQGNATTRATISRLELARLTRSINMQFEIVQDPAGKRGIKVTWARRGRSGMALWDESGTWDSMPERIEAACYDGLSQADQDRMESQPETFPSPEAAWAWGFEQGAFSALQHARNGYEKLKQERQPRSAAEMALLWRSDVERRLAALASPDPGGEEHEKHGERPPEPEAEQADHLGGSR
jgi:hypothetical protein